jgi:hypothetical protein
MFLGWLTTLLSAAASCPVSGGGLRGAERAGRKRIGPLEPPQHPQENADEEEQDGAPEYLKPHG